MLGGVSTPPLMKSRSEKLKATLEECQEFQVRRGPAVVGVICCGVAGADADATDLNSDGGLSWG